MVKVRSHASFVVDVNISSNHQNKIEGLCAYVNKNGFQDRLLFNCANALQKRYESLFDSAKHHFRLYDFFVRFANYFISGMWASARAVHPGRIEELTEGELMLSIWPMVFKLFQMSQRHVISFVTFD